MPRGSRVRLAAVGLGLILAGGLTAPEAKAGSPPKVIYYKSRSFRIPVTVPEPKNMVREIWLQVSDDKGYSWKDYQHTTPRKPEFSFKAPRDGEYWFAVQTVNLQGAVYPRDERPVDPSMVVVVDSMAPSLVLARQARRGSRVTVRWEAQDAHLVIRSLVLEYQVEGAATGDWRKVPLAEGDYARIGIKSWDAGTADPIRVRASIRDRANNVRQVECALADGLAAAPEATAEDARDPAAPPPIAPISSRAEIDEDDQGQGIGDANANNSDANADGSDPFASVAGRSNEPAPRSNEPAATEPAGSSPAPARTPAARSAPNLLTVNSPRFTLNYEVEDAGPNGPSLVELWVTRDRGRTWVRQPEDADRLSPYPVDLGGDGLFGLWLVVQNASGLGDAPPGPGDRPRIWVEVDATPPAVKLDPVRVGVGPQAGKVFLSWRVTDAHLVDRPVTISIRPDRPDAPWQPIAGPMEDNGRLTWTVPRTIPGRFFLRVEALDVAGNRGADETPAGRPVLIDLSRPRSRITGLVPTARAAADGPTRH